jgi:hypothetical protein
LPERSVAAFVPFILVRTAAKRQSSVDELPQTVDERSPPVRERNPNGPTLTIQHSPPVSRACRSGISNSQLVKKSFLCCGEDWTIRFHSRVSRLNFQAT